MKSPKATPIGGSPSSNSDQPTRDDPQRISKRGMVAVTANNEANRRRAGKVWLIPQCLPGVRLGAELDSIFLGFCYDQTTSSLRFDKDMKHLTIDAWMPSGD